jgi:hypothetical protein
MRGEVLGKIWLVDGREHAHPLDDRFRAGEMLTEPGYN